MPHPYSQNHIQIISPNLQNHSATVHYLLPKPNMAAPSLPQHIWLPANNATLVRLERDSRETWMKHKSEGKWYPSIAGLFNSIVQGATLSETWGAGGPVNPINDVPSTPHASTSSKLVFHYFVKVAHFEFKSAWRGTVVIQGCLTENWSFLAHSSLRSPSLQCGEAQVWLSGYWSQFLPVDRYSLRQHQPEDIDQIGHYGA